MADPKEVEILDNGETSHEAPVKKKKHRKPFISPSSSFVDFSNLESETYNPDNMVDNDYDPYAQRRIRKPLSDFETLTHIVKGCIGAGILAMPKGFYYAGVGVGTIGTFLLGLLCGYGIHVMLTMKYLQCKWLRVPYLALPRSLRVAFLNGPPLLHKLAWTAPILSDFFLVVNQIGLCSTYVLFISKSFQRVIEPHEKERTDIRLYMVVLFFPTLLVNYVRNLKKLSFFSLLGDILIAGALSLCFYYIFAVGPWAMNTPGQITVAAPVKTWPLFVSITMFAVDAVGIMITLEHNMKKPAHFLGYRGLFPWSMVFIVTLYAAVGLCTYLKHGENIGETMVNALPPGQTLANFCHLMVAVAIFNSYPIQLYVGLEIIWGNYITYLIKNRDTEFIVEYIMRTGVVLLTFLLALLIPQIDLMVSLVAAFCLSILSIVIPFLLELCTRYPNYGCCYHVLIKDVIFICIGLLILFIGTYVAILKIIEYKSQNQHNGHV